MAGAGKPGRRRLYPSNAAKQAEYRHRCALREIHALMEKYPDIPQPSSSDPEAISRYLELLDRREARDKSREARMQLKLAELTKTLVGYRDPVALLFARLGNVEDVTERLVQAFEKRIDALKQQAIREAERQGQDVSKTVSRDPSGKAASSV